MGSLGKQKKTWILVKYGWYHKNDGRDEMLRQDAVWHHGDKTHGFMGTSTLNSEWFLKVLRTFHVSFSIPVHFLLLFVIFMSLLEERQKLKRLGGKHVLSPIKSVSFLHNSPFLQESTWQLSVRTANRCNHRICTRQPWRGAEARTIRLCLL